MVGPDWVGMERSQRMREREEVGMKRENLTHWTTLLLGLVLLSSPRSATAGPIARPDAMIGHRVGQDYKLARYEKIAAYFQNVRVIGQTTEGRDMILAEITDEATQERIKQAMSDQQTTADPRRFRNKDQERRLVEKAKVVVLVNCNLHSTEIASSQMAMELLHDLATAESPEITEILRRTVIVLIPSANPDGLDKVIDWYKRSIGQPWEGAGMPWLYQTYAGHDNNRDWFMLNLKETQLVTRVIYQEWLPDVVYDIHQMGSQGARFFVPPFFDPKNPNIHPINDHMMLIIGGHMGAALTRADKRGILNSALFDNWWQGGFRTTVYRHNMTGILTEAASVRIASPVFQRKSELRGGHRGMPDYAIATNFPDPWPGGWWRLRDIVDYEKIACMSLFSLTARYHDLFKSNVIKQAREAISGGMAEPPFAWLVPPGQRDSRTAAEMLGILGATGIEVHQAETEFTADGVPYAAGTYVLYCGQPFRSHLNDMMERQVYPNRSSYPGGPAEAPYDAAGWTLPLLMGVHAISVNQPFDCRTRQLEIVALPHGKIAEGDADASGYMVKAGGNDNYRLMNRLFAADVPVHILDASARPNAMTTREAPLGSLFIADANGLRRAGDAMLDGLSCVLTAIQADPSEAGRTFQRVSRPRLGLYQPWTASIDEGWTRFVLDRFEFDYTSVHNAEVRAGDLSRRYDCLVLPSVGAGSIIRGRPVDTTEPQYVGGIGSEGIVAFQTFVRDGGTLVCIDNSCNFPIDHFNIPVRNVVRGKASKEFFCPGSLLRIWIDRRHPVGYGMPEWVSGYFARSQAFEITDGPKGGEKDPRSPAARFETHVLARYSDTVLLESGWIRGGGLIADKPAAVEIRYGQGRIILLGFRIQHRGQSHGTFALLFNAILSSAIEP
jgi:zinc carboxypeptidase